MILNLTNHTRQLGNERSANQMIRFGHERFGVTLIQAAHKVPICRSCLHQGDSGQRIGDSLSKFINAHRCSSINSKEIRHARIP